MVVRVKFFKGRILESLAHYKFLVVAVVDSDQRDRAVRGS